MRALAREPRDRFESAGAFAAALTAALDEVPTTPARRSGPARTSYRLPPSPNRMIGRERELAEIVALLRRGDRPLVTLVGPAGVGKTRLAIDVARGMAADFARGAALVALAGAHQAADLAAMVCMQLGLRSGEDESALGTLMRVLGPSRLLLVLDSVEHLAHAPALVAEILRTCPGVTQLVTSRAPLELTAEQCYVVSPLELEPAIELFLERASLRSDAAEDSVADVCRRLDALPLAIELAAAATPLLSVRELGDRLAGALPIPAAGPRDTPDRQRTLEAAFDWSYDRLDAAARDAFERFAAFAAGSTLAAAEQVTGATLDVLHSLLAKSLLMRRSEGREPRLFMLQTVRDYAKRRMKAPENAHARHFDWCAGFADQAETGLAGPEQAAWLARLDAEHPNCLAALEWSIEAERPDLTLRLAGALAEYWYVRRGYVDGVRFLKAGLSAEGVQGWEHARAHAGMGHLVAFRLGERDRALRHLNQALKLFRALDDICRAAACASTIATVEAALGRREQASLMASRALRLARRAHDSRTVGLALLAGVIAARDFATGKPLLEEGVVMFRNAGDRISLADLLDNAGYLALTDGMYDQARVLLDDAVELSRGNDDVVGLTYALENRAMVEILVEDWDRAVPMLREVLELCERNAVQAPLPEVLAGLAGFCAVQRDDERAAALYGASRELRFGR